MNCIINRGCAASGLLGMEKGEQEAELFCHSVLSDECLRKSQSLSSTPPQSIFQSFQEFPVIPGIQEVVCPNLMQTGALLPVWHNICLLAITDLIPLTK